MFDNERCEHGIPWAMPCPTCIAAALARIQRERDLLTDDLPPMRPFVPAKDGDPD